MNEIAIFVEGGGSAESRAQFRRGLSAFFGSVVKEVRAKGVRWNVVPCGGRTETYKAFVDAHESDPQVFNVLLVDSEEPLDIAVSPWLHLSNREEDQWKRPAGVDDQRCQLMVACMEAWFIADPAALEAHFGSKFATSKLPAASRAESCTKEMVFKALNASASYTKAGKYQKIRDAVRLLQNISATKVRGHCKWCDRLFATLENSTDS